MKLRTFFHLLIALVLLGGCANSKNEDPTPNKRIHIELNEVSPEQITEAERLFEENLKLRESQYPEVKPKEGMISISKAESIAVAHVQGGFDKTQKAKVELIENVYKVTLWKHRQPTLSQTGFAAIVDVDAWTGEIINLLLSSD